MPYYDLVVVFPLGVFPSFNSTRAHTHFFTHKGRLFLLRFNTREINHLGERGWGWAHEKVASSLVYDERRGLRVASLGSLTLSCHSCSTLLIHGERAAIWKRANNVATRPDWFLQGAALANGFIVFPDRHPQGRGGVESGNTSAFYTFSCFRRELFCVSSCVGDGGTSKATLI